MIDLTNEDFEELRSRVVSISRFERPTGEQDFWVHGGSLQDILEVFIPEGTSVVRLLEV